MIQRTLGDVRSEIARVCGTSGMPVTDIRVVRLLNLAIQELMNEVNSPGVVDRWHLRVADGHIVLPPELDMLLEFTVDGVPQQIASPWAELVNYGPGLGEDIRSLSGRGYGVNRNWWGCTGGNLYDRGEFPVRTQIPVSDGSCGCIETPVGPWTIRQYVTAGVDEATDIYSTVQGLDDNGLQVRTRVLTSDGSGMEWINGERIPISDGSGYFSSTQTFSKITGYTKPQTNGYVRITAWNGTTEVELSNYAPWETTPSYHHYWSPVLNDLQCEGSNSCARVVFARCRRRFVPVEQDTDLLIISNVLALKEMIIAQWKREANSLTEYAAHKVTAVEILKKESIAYTGKVRMPALSFQRGASIGSLPFIR